MTKAISVVIAAAALIGTAALSQPARAGDAPTFAVDASWPKPLPNNWIIGQVGGIADGFQRPHLGHPPAAFADRRRKGRRA